MEITDSGYSIGSSASPVTVPNDGHVYGIAVCYIQYTYQTGSFPTNWGDIGASRNGQSFISIYKKDKSRSYSYDAGCAKTTEYARYESVTLYLYNADPGTYDIILSNTLYTTRYNWYLIKDAVATYELTVDTSDHDTPYVYTITNPKNGILISNSVLFKAGGTYPKSYHFAKVDLYPNDNVFCPGYAKVITPSDYQLSISWTNTTEWEVVWVGLYFWNKTHIPLFAFH